MALRHAKQQPTVQEKRYITLQFLEAAYVSGNRVIVTPVNTYKLTALSGEVFTYKDPVETYMIYDERPKVGLLKKFGWFREDIEELPQIAYIPTHLLYNKFKWDNGTVIPIEEILNPETGDQWFDIENSLLYTYDGLSWGSQEVLETAEYDITELGQLYFDAIQSKLYTSIPGDVINEVLLEGAEIKELVETGESDTYELRPLEIKRGTLLDVFFDFSPEARTATEAYDGNVSPFDRPIDSSTALNRFYVTDPKIDTVSINYTCKLMAYKYDAAKEATEDQNPSNGEYLEFDSDSFDI